MDIESEILELAKTGQLSLGPVGLDVLSSDVTLDDGLKADALIEARWKDQAARFVAVFRTQATPKVLQLAISTAREVASPPETYPLVIAPYLSDDKLQRLEAAGISGLDLCGNGVLCVPGKMMVMRTGRPNRFPQSAKLKNVYRGKNSLVGRAFLIRPRFSMVKDIVGFLEERGGGVAFSTVSKALKRLDEDLIISRQGDSIRLLQPETLMDNLAANYQPPEITERFRGKSSMPVEKLIRNLSSSLPGENNKLVLTGAASSEKYAVMAKEPMVSVYTTLSPRSLLKGSNLDVKETDRFANIEILRTDDARVFFDKRVEDDIPYASPVQTWLELSSGDKRQKDAAKQVRSGILAELNGV